MPNTSLDQVNETPCRTHCEICQHHQSTGKVFAKVADDLQCAQGPPLQQAQAGLPTGISQAMVHDVLPQNGGLQVESQGEGVQFDARQPVIKAGAVRRKVDPAAEA